MLSLSALGEGDSSDTTDDRPALPRPLPLSAEVGVTGMGFTLLLLRRGDGLLSTDRATCCVRDGDAAVDWYTNCGAAGREDPRLLDAAPFDAIGCGLGHGHFVESTAE